MIKEKTTSIVRCSLGSGHWTNLIIWGKCSECMLGYSEEEKKKLKEAAERLNKKTF